MTIKERYTETLKKYPEGDIDQKRLAFNCKRLGTELENARQAMALCVATEDEARFAPAQFNYEKTYDEIEKRGCRISVEKEKERTSKLSRARSILASTVADRDAVQIGLDHYVQQATKRLKDLDEQIEDQENKITVLEESAEQEAI